MNNNFNIDDEHIIKGDNLLHDVNCSMGRWTCNGVSTGVAAIMHVEHDTQSWKMWRDE